MNAMANIAFDDTKSLAEQYTALWSDPAPAEPAKVEAEVVQLVKADPKRKVPAALLAAAENGPVNRIKLGSWGPSD